MSEPPRNGNGRSAQTHRPEAVLDAFDAADRPLPAPVPSPAPGSRARFLLVMSSMSVRYKIAGTFVAILVLAIASLGAVTFSRQKKMLQEETNKRAEVLVDQLAGIGKEGLLTQEELPVYTVIKEIQRNAGVVYAMVLDSKGRVFVHSSLAQKGKTLDGPIARAALDSDGLVFQRTSVDGEPVLDAAVPIVYKARNLRLGTARIGLSETDLLEAIHRQKVAFVWISLGFLAVGLILSSALAQVLTKPIYTLSVGMQVVAQGDLSQQVRVWSKDEIGKLTEAFNSMTLSLREKLHMEKYLSFSALRSIRKNRLASQLRLGGERKRVTALFSDVRGFTAMSEKMSPEEVIELLNIYLNLQSKVIQQRGGIVDKFIGDEVMAIFEGEEQELNAVRAAVEIQRFVQALNWARSKSGRRQMQVGMGLNSGEVVMGNMGSEHQMNYTVIGDNINLAARLCGAAQSGQVVVSKPVADAVTRFARLKKLEPVSLKGKDKPVDVFEVLEVRGAARRYLRREAAASTVYRLAGLSEESTPALARNIGPSGCLLESAMPLGVGSRLDLELDLKGSDRIEVQAVVRHVRKQEGKYYAGVSFEELKEANRVRIIEWVHQIETEITVRTVPPESA